MSDHERACNAGNDAVLEHFALSAPDRLWQIIL
jgi:hypothetical protein